MVDARIDYLDEAVLAELLDVRSRRACARHRVIAVRGMKRALDEIVRNRLDEADRRHRENMHGDKVREDSALHISDLRGLNRGPPSGRSSVCHMP